MPLINVLIHKSLSIEQPILGSPEGKHEGFVQVTDTRTAQSSHDIY